jgi:hypothetical protein
MLDTIFAVSVLAAVIFFGALISVGNEHQRQAIDSLREQTIHWAEADLRLKRIHVLHTQWVESPKEWLDRVLTRLLGASPVLLSISPWHQNEVKAIVGVCKDGRHMVVTPVQPARFIKALTAKPRSRLQKAEVGLLGDHPRRVPVHELNIVTAGEFFDLEAATAWQKAMGSRLEIERLYLFEVPPVRGK